MTKDQKTTQVTDMVQDLRRFYTMTEFVDMVKEVWKGMDQAKLIAQEGAPPVSPP